MQDRGNQQDRGRGLQDRGNQQDGGVQVRGPEPIEGGRSTQAEGSAQAAIGVSAKTGWRLASFMNSSTGESFLATKKSLVAPANCR